MTQETDEKSQPRMKRVKDDKTYSMKLSGLIGASSKVLRATAVESEEEILYHSLESLAFGPRDASCRRRPS